MGSAALFAVYFGIVLIGELVIVAPAQTAEQGCPSSFSNPPLILVSLDGFRADYINWGRTPTIWKLADNGVTVPFMKPSYPSITFPNHYTIVTGLLPAYHGIVSNKFFDPNLNATFRVGRPEFYQNRFWGGEPIWKTAERQGLKAAVYFWIGSEVEGLQPTYFQHFNNSHPFEHRVDKVLSWLDLPPEERPSFLALYIGQPDRQGHNFGLDTIKISEALVKVDSAIHRLLMGLKKRHLENCVNLIILADHGMASAGPQKVINIQDYIPEVNTTTSYWNGVFPRFEPLDKSKELTLKYMKQLSCQRQEMRVFHKKELPVRWHLSSSPRVEDIVLDLDSGFQVDFDGTYRPDQGDHGYDNYFSDMNALFLGFGPAFRRKVEAETFQNIELYNMMCHLLKIEPAPNNGTKGSLNRLLRNPPPLTSDFTKERLPQLARLDASNSEKRDSSSWIEDLRLAENKVDELLLRHLPWGMPHMEMMNLSTKLLVHKDHITVFSEKLGLPLFTSFHYTQTGVSKGGLWADDIRLPTGSIRHSSKFSKLQSGLSWEPLFHPDFATYSQRGRQIPYLTSNAVPMSEISRKHWQEFRRILRQWLDVYRNLNVMIGLAFDLDRDTFADDLSKLSDQEARLVRPTHIYAVVTRCIGGRWMPCEPENMDVSSFILPQHLMVSNCMSSNGFMREFSSKVNDIESMAGMKLYPKLPLQDQVRLRTRIHSNLWGHESWRNRIRSNLFGLRK